MNGAIDAVAEQLLHPFGQRGDDMGRDGERHVLYLAHPRLAVLRCKPEPDAIAAVGFPPRCSVVPRKTTTDPGDISTERIVGR